MPLSHGSREVLRYGVSLALLIALVWPTRASAGLWYVKPDRSGDAPTIQAAIDAAAADAEAVIDTILVAPGHYTWRNQLTGDEFGLIRFWKQAGDDIHLISEGGPEVTLLDAQYFGRVFFANGDNLASDPVEFLIEGFTFMNGNAPSYANRPEREGGAMAMHLCYTTVRNCIFRNNRAEYGGAVWLGGVGSHHFEDCTFIGNHARTDRNGVFVFGGGLAVINSTAQTTFERCEFLNNDSSYRGGGAVVVNALVDFVDCVFAENSSTNTDLGTGTALYLYDTHAVTLERTLIVENDTSNGTAFLIRRVDSTDMQVDVRHCLIANNFPGSGVRVTAPATFECTNIFGHFGGDWIGNLDYQLELNGNMRVPPKLCRDQEHPRWVELDSPMLAAHNDCGENIGGVVPGCGQRLHSLLARWTEGGAEIRVDIEASASDAEGFGLERHVDGLAPVTLTTTFAPGGGTDVFLDVEAPVSGAIYWLVDREGDRVGDCELGLKLPSRGDVLAVLGAFPNPFNPSARIYWQQPGSGPARLRLLSACGRTVRVLFDGPAVAGQNDAIWDGTDDAGRSVASGVYFVEVAYNGATSRGKIALVR